VNELNGQNIEAYHPLFPDLPPASGRQIREKEVASLF
jgi:hypothetical protein